MSTFCFQGVEEEFRVVEGGEVKTKLSFVEGSWSYSFQGGSTQFNPSAVHDYLVVYALQKQTNK